MEDEINVVTSMSSEITKNSVFCPTISLAFKEFFESVLKNDYLYCGNNKEIKDIEKDLLNLQLNDEIYYTKSGKATLQLKKQIEKDIYKKFKETSDLLKKIDFEKESNKILVYAMLKLALEFQYKFKILKDASFNNSDKLVKYFGFDVDEMKEMRKQVYPMFYESENEFACSIDAQNGSVILYRTDEVLPFETMYQKCMSKANEFSEDTKIIVRDFKAPELELKVLKNFENLVGEKFMCNKDLQEYFIDKVLQQITFELNNSGAKVKSEAIMMIEKCCLDRRRIMTESFVFDKPFYLFMQDNSSEMPVLCIRVNDIEKFVK